MKMNMQADTFPYQWFRTKTRFDAEANGNIKRPIGIAECDTFSETVDLIFP